MSVYSCTSTTISFLSHSPTQLFFFFETWSFTDQELTDLATLFGQWALDSVSSVLRLHMCSTALCSFCMSAEIWTQVLMLWAISSPQISLLRWVSNKYVRALYFSAEHPVCMYRFFPWGCFCFWNIAHHLAVAFFENSFARYSHTLLNYRSYS